jgi:hypothetical protein
MLSEPRFVRPSGNKTTARRARAKNEINTLRRDQMLRRLTLEHIDALVLTGALAVSVIAYAVLFTNINSILN